jgi:CDGSH-type Zn-finger protein
LRLAGAGILIAAVNSEQSLPTTITAYQDGPYLVRGSIRLLDQRGEEISSPRRTVALCRCGKSRMRPFCDGTHRSIRFRAPSEAEQWPALSDGDDLATERRPPDGDARGQNGNDEGSRLSFARPDVPDARSLSLVRSHLREADRCVGLTLRRSVSAADYTKISLAEPLIRAALHLLEGPHRRVLGARSDATLGASEAGRAGIGSCRQFVDAARATMSELQADGDARLAQVGRLLDDAAQALSS